MEYLNLQEEMMTLNLILFRVQRGCLAVEPIQSFLTALDQFPSLTRVLDICQAHEKHFLINRTFMKEDAGHGQEVTRLAFVETDLPLVASYNSQRATKGQRNTLVIGNRGLLFVYMPWSSRNNVARMN